MESGDKFGDKSFLLPSSVIIVKNLFEHILKELWVRFDEIIIPPNSITGVFKYTFYKAGRDPITHLGNAQ